MRCNEHRNAYQEKNLCRHCCSYFQSQLPTITDVTVEDSTNEWDPKKMFSKNQILRGKGKFSRQQPGSSRRFHHSYKLLPSDTLIKWKASVTILVANLGGCLLGVLTLCFLRNYPIVVVHILVINFKRALLQGTVTHG